MWVNGWGKEELVYDRRDDKEGNDREWVRDYDLEGLVDVVR